MIVCSNQRTGNDGNLCQDVAPGFWLPKFAEMGVDAREIKIVNEGVTNGWHRSQEASGYLNDE